MKWTLFKDAMPAIGQPLVILYLDFAEVGLTFCHTRTGWLEERGFGNVIMDAGNQLSDYEHATLEKWGAWAYLHEATSEAIAGCAFAKGHTEVITFEGTGMTVSVETNEMLEYATV